jgi:hypothetical protein
MNGTPLHVGGTGTPLSATATAPAPAPAAAAAAGPPPKKKAKKEKAPAWKGLTEEDEARVRTFVGGILVELPEALKSPGSIASHKDKVVMVDLAVRRNSTARHPSPSCPSPPSASAPHPIRPSRRRS